MRLLPFVLALSIVPLAGCLSDAGSASAGVPPADSDGSTTAWTPVWAPLDQAEIRPGTAAPGCTFNWLFVDPAAQAYFIGIAAHCTSSDDDEEPADGTGERIGSSGASEDEAWGTIVYDSDNRTLQEDFGVEDRVDFTLIRLDEGANLRAHPQMMGYEAPVGFIPCGEAAVGDRMGWHGYGMVFGDLDPTRKREGVIGVCDGRDYGAYTNAIWGDSGSAVVHVGSGKALGIVSRLGIDTMPPTELTGATLPYILTELAKVPGFEGVRLATIDGSYVGLEG
jgi:hypothetical protein